MSAHSLNLDANDQTNRVSADLFDSRGNSSFEISVASNTAIEGAVYLTPVQGMGALMPSEFGQLTATSITCVSDAAWSTMQSKVNIGFEQALLDGLETLSMMNHADVSSLLELSQSLVTTLPEVGRGLSGELSGAELSALIDSMQGKLLELQTASDQLFGGLGESVNEAATDLEGATNDALFASAQVDLAEIVDQTGGVAQPSVGEQAVTLEALFSNPDSVPLVMEVSSSDANDAFSEIFASTSSSIGSTATSDADASNDLLTDSSKPV